LQNQLVQINRCPNEQGLHRLVADSLSTGQTLYDLHVEIFFNFGIYRIDEAPQASPTLQYHISPHVTTDQQPRTRVGDSNLTADRRSQLQVSKR
jgi:hypothetical protein